MKNLQDRKFLLKKDRYLQTEFGGDPLTNDNMTDERAEQLLRENPVLIKHFDRYPDEFKVLEDNAPAAPVITPLRPLDTDTINAFVIGLTGDEKIAFIDHVKAGIESNQVVTITTIDGDRDLTIEQMQAIITEFVPPVHQGPAPDQQGPAQPEAGAEGDTTQVEPAATVMPEADQAEVK